MSMSTKSCLIVHGCAQQLLSIEGSKDQLKTDSRCPIGRSAKNGVITAE